MSMLSDTVAVDDNKIEDSFEEIDKHKTEKNDLGACDKEHSDKLSFKKMVTFNITKLLEAKAWISSMDTLPNGRVVMADFSNNKLYIYSQDLEKQKSVIVPGKPCCLTVLDNEKVAVTLQEKSSVAVINIMTRKTLRFLKTPDSCHGITYCDEKIVVNCLESGLQFMDTCGKIKTTVSDVTGEASLCSCGNEYIYCSVYWSHKILCYNNLAEEIYSFSNLTIKCPRGIAIHPSGQALTTEFAKNRIHAINTEGTKSAVVLSKKHDITNPLCILFNIHDDCLYVANNDGESVTIYKYNKT